MQRAGSNMFGSFEHQGRTKKVMPQNQEETKAMTGPPPLSLLLDIKSQLGWSAWTKGESNPALTDLQSIKSME